MCVHVYRVHVCLCELGGLCQTVGLGLSQSHSVVCWCLVSEEEKEKMLLTPPLLWFLNNLNHVKPVMDLKTVCVCVCVNER